MLQVRGKSYYEIDDYMKEKWITIKEYNDYKVSNYGNILSFKQNKEKLLNLISDKKGYLIISLFKNNIQKNFRINRLVAQTFLPNPESKPEINHIDGNKQNNYVDNLEWVTHSENMKHAYKLGLCFQKGEKNNASKLTNNDVLMIHGLYLSFFSKRELALLFNISISNICYILNGKTWKHL